MEYCINGVVIGYGNLTIHSNEEIKIKVVDEHGVNLELIGFVHKNDVTMNQGLSSAEKYLAWEMGNRIQAIKSVRDRLFIGGLKEAKDLVDDYLTEMKRKYPNHRERRAIYADAINYNTRTINFDLALPYY